MTERLDVERMLEGARLVVVGGTGFLGKVFWSMLLDRYPKVGRIFLVVRPRGGQSSGRHVSGSAGAWSIFKGSSDAQRPR